MRYFNFLFLLSLITMISCQQNDPLINNVIVKDLNANWQFKQTDEKLWMPATVPGTVHTDLMANGIIEDPYYRTNEKDIQWIDKKDWEYKSVFEVDKQMLDKKEVLLVFDGLDTYATVYLNGNKILQADNMFRRWEISCKEYLKEGENELKIVFQSPTMAGLKLLEANGYPLPASNDQSENGEMGENRVSIFTRKAGYHYGWDWGPRLVTSGIWRPVQLIGFDYGKIENFQVIQKELTDQKATLEAIVEFYAIREGNYDFVVYLDGQRYLSETRDLALGSNKVDLNFEISNPELWWPNGMGDQHLYEVEIDVEKDGKTLVYQAKEDIGLRMVELVQESDEAGKSFYFKVNGHPVFARGANYIPNDVFLPRFQSEDYERIIKDAADAHMNMLRVWGGGIYENDIFYDLCDRYGIMVWQDFMYACSMYPGDDDFLNNARIEAEENIIRLRNHPSIVLWCGNNEIEVAWAEYEEDKGWGWKQLYTKQQRKQIWHDYDTLFHHILPEAVKKYNPQTAYWHSSPSAGMGQLAGYESTSGDMHYWGVWHGQHPFSDFRKYRARFMSEYGFQSFPEFNTVKTYALPEDYDIESEVMAHHQRSGIGNLRIRQYMEEDYIIPEDFETFLYVSQLLQAEAIKMAIESHRADRPYCMGTLYWQLNDCWPVASWSGIDYYGRWKAMHYFVKKAYQNTIVASFQDGNEVEVWAITDELERQEARVDFQVLDFDGQLLNEESMALVLDPASSKMIKKFPLDLIEGLGNKNQMFLLTKIYVDDQLTDEDIHYFVKPKDLQTGNHEPAIEVVSKGNTMEIKFSSDHLVKNIFLSTGLSNDHFSDNYFDLLPGETKYVTIPGKYTADDFFNSLKVMFLVN